MFKYMIICSRLSRDLVFINAMPYRYLDQLQQSGVRLIEAHGTSKWSWAGHVSRRPVRSWVWRVTVWRDSDWQSLMLESCTARPLRPSRRRWMKWEDILRRFCTAAGLKQWKSLSQDRSKWAGKADTFSKWFCSE